ncbi:CorA family divalent cation transporter [Nannocystis pusilla]|uniref:CorA family divalent cation transporter n=1 Tax=Nannocystis pusilla TaxID=889268 RepID=A0ABS7TIR1_9BACT|nr:CorA family divalent cation transporter [Nannocystis pusilla]MBZ5708001.1 CorA family divalent cation transporter [Nannocystis pusilla]
MSSPIPHQWQVPEVFRERMGHQAGRQRVMSHAGHVLLILHELPDPETPERRAAKMFWRNPEGTWQCSAGGPPGISTLMAHVETFIEAANKLETRGDHARTADEWFALIQAAGPMLRTARNMHRALQEAREAAKTDRGLITTRDLAGDAERAFELIHAHAQEGLRYTSARQAEEQARGAQHMLEAAHRLNMIAAVFLPVTAVATLLGMNLRHGLESWPAPQTFWITLALCFAFGLWIKASMPRPQPAEEPKPPGKGKAKAGKGKR